MSVINNILGRGYITTLKELDGKETPIYIPVETLIEAKKVVEGMKDLSKRRKDGCKFSEPYLR